MPKVQLPPEWAFQDAVLLTWPHRHSDWSIQLEQVDSLFTRIACEIAQRETVIIACYDEEHRAHVADQLMHSCADLNHIELYCVPSNDAWARDHGPVTIYRGGEPVMLDFVFNGWGGKYPADLDNELTRQLVTAGAFGSTQARPVNFVLEGGSIEVDGAGSLLTTESCLLSPTRNPGCDRPRVEATLREQLGVERVLWLAHGALIGDDTDGHVDTLARFCNPTTLAYTACDDPDDAHYPELQAMEAELLALRQPDGTPYEPVRLPLPAPIHNSRGERLPATYANFLIINAAVLVPVYGDPMDEIACERLAAQFPDRTLVPIDCRPLISQYGSLHCVTMQLPRGVLARSETRASPV